MEIKCPKCGASKFNTKLEQDGGYVCINKLPSGQYCRTLVGAICKQCNKFYYFDNFGKHGDVYECKECGRTNWPLTDYIREVTEFERKMKAIHDEAQAFRDEMMNT